MYHSHVGLAFKRLLVRSMCSYRAGDACAHLKSLHIKLNVSNRIQPGEPEITLLYITDTNILVECMDIFQEIKYGIGIPFFYSIIDVH